MPHGASSVRSRSVRRLLAQALAAMLIPAGVAHAQTASYVRVARAESDILTSRQVGTLLMNAPQGTLLEVVHTRGDRYRHRDDNWYWVLVPPDSWGTQRLGWIRGSEVEPAPAPPRPPMKPAVTESRIISSTPAEAPPPTPVPVVAPTTPLTAKPPVTIPPEVAEFGVLFEFAKSDLTADARLKLAEAVALLKEDATAVSFALEGHADWVGPEPYNDKLGLARAEAVKRYLADQHQIPADKMSTVSYGESQPAATNDTRDGRAQNRRVVVKVTP